MSTITILPQEIMSHILTYIPDTLPSSMVCKLWSNILKKISIQNYNNPHYLKQQYTIQNINTLINHIPYITNHNCLNFITSTIFITPISNSHLHDDTISRHYIYMLLMQNCETNNVSNPEYIHILIKHLIKNSMSPIKYFLRKAYNISLHNQSFDMMIIISTYYDIMRYLKYTYNYQENVDIIIQQIEILSGKNIISLLEICEMIYCSTMPCKIKLLNYFEQKLDGTTIKCIKSKCDHKLKHK
jgi:hypothetical protein